MADALDAAIDRLLKLARKRVWWPAKKFGTGVSDGDIAAREREIGNAIPSDVRTLFQRVSPEAWKTVFGDQLQLHPIASAGWCSASNGLGSALLESEESASEWNGIATFCFAWFIHGDEVLFCPSHPEFGKNFVLMADHESDERAIVLASSLADWIDRLCDHDGTDYAYCSGDLDQLKTKERRAFLEAHAELNPHVEWPARMLAKLDYPKGRPDGYYHWDRKAGKLRPVGEVENVYSVVLDEPTLVEVESLAAAPSISSVIIDGGTAWALDVLAQLPNLEYVGLYDVESVDVRSLAASRSLTKVCVMRSKVSGLTELATIPKLGQVEVGTCRYAQAEVDELHRRCPKLYIDVVDEAKRRLGKRRG